MLFKFLGNSDAPDWVLSEMNTLSLVSSVRIKFILLQIYNIIIGAQVNHDNINMHLQDAKLSDGQKRSLLALLSYIVENAVRFDVEPEDLAQELTQLGAPHSHASTINRFYKEYRRNLRKVFKQNFIQFAKPELIEHRAEIILKSKNGQPEPHSAMHVRFQPSNNKPFTVSMTKEQVTDLTRELRTAISLLRVNK